MAQVSQGRRMPKGYIYYDKSSKGGKYRHNRWCAEIYFANVRLRKRSCDRTELERWLELVSTTIRKSLIRQIDEASSEAIREAISSSSTSVRSEALLKMNFGKSGIFLINSI